MYESVPMSVVKSLPYISLRDLSHNTIPDRQRRPRTGKLRRLTFIERAGEG